MSASIPSNTSLLTIGNQENAVDYLEKGVFFLSTIKLNPINWKWVTICLFQALYGFAIIAMQGSNIDNVLDKKGRLVNFKKAIERLKALERYSYSNVLALTDAQQFAIDKFHEEFRNNFVHFKTNLWSIETSGFPKITLSILEVIEFITLKSGNIIWTREEINDDGESLVKKKIEDLILKAKNIINKDLI